MTSLRTRLRRLLPNLALSVASLAISLVAFELFLRLFLPIQYRMPARQLTPDAWRAQIHRPGSVPGLLYELAPNVHQESHDTMIVTNSYGMRDDQPIEPRPPDLVRIAAIGDSHTFGFGVLSEDAWPNVLERLLNESAAGQTRFEVLNLGVGGYATRDEAIVLKYKALAWDPDLVIIGYVTNDPEIDPCQPLQSYFTTPAWWQLSDVLRLIAKTQKMIDLYRLGGGNFTLYFHRKDRAPWASVLAGFRDIGKTSKESGVPVLLAIFPDSLKNGPVDKEVAKVYDQVARAAQNQGIRPLILAPAFKANTDHTLHLSSRDDHPNVKGHRVAAEAIRDEILAHPDAYLRRLASRGIKLPISAN